MIIFVLCFVFFKKEREREKGERKKEEKRGERRGEKKCELWERKSKKE